MPTQPRPAIGWRLFCLLISIFLVAAPLWTGGGSAAALVGSPSPSAPAQAEPVIVTQQAYIKASNASSLDTFGHPLASTAIRMTIASRSLARPTCLPAQLAPGASRPI